METTHWITDLKCDSLTQCHMKKKKKTPVNRSMESRKEETKGEKCVSSSVQKRVWEVQPRWTFWLDLQASIWSSKGDISLWQPLTSAIKPSSHSLLLLYCSAPQRGFEGICFSCPLRECNDHLPHTSDPLGTSISHPLVCVVFYCEGGWHDLGTHGVLGCFSFWTCNPENQTLSPGTIMPLGDPAEVVNCPPLVYIAILILYSVKCPKQQENQYYM